MIFLAILISGQIMFIRNMIQNGWQNLPNSHGQNLTNSHGQKPHKFSWTKPHTFSWTKPHKFSWTKPHKLSWTKPHKFSWTKPHIISWQMDHYPNLLYAMRLVAALRSLCNCFVTWFHVSWHYQLLFSAAVKELADLQHALEKKLGGL